jgi:twitching motility protein PilU
VVTLEEALANSDSPTNFSWLVNNAPAEGEDAPKGTPEQQSMVQFEPEEPDGASFSAFSFHMDESEAKV